LTEETINQDERTSERWPTKHHLRKKFYVKTIKPRGLLGRVDGRRGGRHAGERKREKEERMRENKRKRERKRKRKKSKEEDCIGKSNKPCSLTVSPDRTVLT
jgi:hypothetical protein